MKKMWNQYLLNYDDEAYDHLYHPQFIKRMTKRQASINLPISLEVSNFDGANIPDSENPLTENLMIFVENYKHFSHGDGKYLFDSGKASHEIFNKYFEFFWMILEKCENKGGFEEICAENSWEYLQNETEDLESILAASGKSCLRELYECYLFHYEKQFSAKIDRTELLDFKKVIQDLKPEYVQEVKIFHPSEIDIFSEDDLINKILPTENCMFRGFLDTLNFNNNLFSPATLSENHGNFLVDVVNQDPTFFNFFFSKNSDCFSKTEKSMSISEYANYMEEFTYSSTQNVKFAVNIDIEEWHQELSEIRKLPEWLLWQSKRDGLSYLIQSVKGMTSPQVYMKVKGVWTGGHEENLRAQAVNINHGPSDCIWYTIDTKYAAQFRAKVLQIFHYDIYKSRKEQLWFCNVDFCIANGIPVTKFIQKPGDIVLLTQGCLHWVRSKGNTVNSAWNFLFKQPKQIRDVVERYTINRRIKFENLVPVKFLILNLLNHEPIMLNRELFNECFEFLKTKYSKEQAELTRKIQIQVEQKDSKVMRCYSCYDDPFFYWAYEDGSEYTHFYCLKCALKRRKIIKDAIYFYKRFDEKFIENFFAKKYEDFNEKKEGCRFPELCKYKYVGDSLCSRQSLISSDIYENLKEIDQDVSQSSEFSTRMLLSMKNENSKGFLMKPKRILNFNKKYSDEKKKIYSMQSTKKENFEFLKRKSPLNLKEDENDEDKMLTEINNFTINKKVKVDNSSTSSIINKNIQNTAEKMKREINNKNDEDVSIKKKGALHFLNQEFVYPTDYQENDVYKLKKFSSKLNYEEPIETEIIENMSSFVPMTLGSGSALLSLISGRK